MEHLAYALSLFFGIMAMSYRRTLQDRNEEILLLRIETFKLEQELVRLRVERHVEAQKVL